MAKKRARSYGAGCVYERKDSPFLWIKWYVDGKPYTDSSKTTNRVEAQRILNKLINLPEPPSRESIDTLLDGLLRHYKLNRRESSYAWCRYVVEASLRPQFGKIKASKLRKTHLQDFVHRRLASGRANATVKNDLVLLQRAFSLEEVAFPKFQKPIANKVREVILKDDEFELLHRHLPDHVKTVALFSFETGCRLGEILSLRWDQTALHGPDGKRGIIRLRGGETKNGEAKSIPLTDRLRVALRSLRSSKENDSPYVFTYRGRQLRDIRTSWRKGCEVAGLVDSVGKPRFRFHDLRRTAITAMTRSGIPETIIMRISGHKTRSVFDRYNLASDEDLWRAVNTARGPNRSNSTSVNLLDHMQPKAATNAR
jgi:integrase